MILIPYSYNGTALQSTDYITEFPRASANLQIQTNPSYIKRAGTYPVFSGKDFQPHVLQLEIICKHDFTDLFESINTLFDTKDETPRQFICSDNSTTDYWYVYATPKQVLGGHDGNMVTVSLALDDPIWQSYVQNTQTFSTTDSTSSTSLTITGNDYSYPILEITPSASSTNDYSYRVYAEVLPRSAYPWNNRFLDLTGTTDTTWDTAALVAAGKMQADGDDLRVFRDGVEVDRWLNGINSTDTHVIVSVDMPKAIEMTLAAALGATDTVTEITVPNTSANVEKITGLPTNGRLIVDASLGSTDTEEFTYTAKTISATKLAFTINQRGVRGTTAVAHAAGANVRYLPYDFTIVYGNTASTSPETDDTRKPMPALTSRNWSFVYSNFYDLAGLRPDCWQPSFYVPASAGTASRSRYYTSTYDAGDTDPATAMGMAAYTYQSLGAWRADTVSINWSKYFPDGVTSVSASGAQNQSSANRPENVFLRAGVGSGRAVLTTLWSITAPSATDYGTWKTWSKSSSDAAVPAGTIALYWRMSGTQLGTTDANTRVELSSITVGLSNYPHIRLITEAANCNLDSTITNATTGESFRVHYPMTVNEVLYIDTDPDFPTVKYKGIAVNGAIKTSSTRAAWLKLQPGANTIQYQNNNSGASAISIAIKWRNRMNFF